MPLYQTYKIIKDVSSLRLKAKLSNMYLNRLAITCK